MLAHLKNAIYAVYFECQTLYFHGLSLVAVLAAGWVTLTFNTNLWMGAYGCFTIMKNVACVSDIYSYYNFLRRKSWSKKLGNLVFIGFIVVEREVIKREKDDKKLNAINAQIDNLREDLKDINGQWRNEKAIVEEIQDCKRKIEELDIQAQKAERESNFELVTTIRDGKIKKQEQ